jgi:acyl-CoA thioester hydrolase
MRASLIPSTDPGDYPFVHRVRARFAETDAMGVIHHGAYATYLEEARVELLRAGGLPYDRVRSGGIDVVVVELSLRYRRPVRFDDQVDIWVGSGGVTRATFQLTYLLQGAGETRATAVTAHGAVDAAGRPVRLPAVLAEVLAPGHPER